MEVFSERDIDVSEIITARDCTQVVRKLKELSCDILIGPVYPDGEEKKEEKQWDGKSILNFMMVRVMGPIMRFVAYGESHKEDLDEIEKFMEQMKVW